MATRITIKGQVTIPKKVRDALQLAPGDGVEFEPNDSGQFVVRKAQPTSIAHLRRRKRRPLPEAEAQRRRRAEELLALLRGLD